MVEAHDGQVHVRLKDLQSLWQKHQFFAVIIRKAKKFTLLHWFWSIGGFMGTRRRGTDTFFTKSL